MASVTGLLGFHRREGRELFDKCREFRVFTDGLRREGFFQSQYRVTLESPLDHVILVRDPFTGQSREMLCFDSNSYLGLHLDPRVVGAAKRVMDVAGYGTPSAQVLGGTNRWLRELEEAISAFYDREDTVVFPTGYAANVGALTGLLRAEDLVARDRFSHASIHDGCRWSGARHGGVYGHLDLADLDRMLERDGPKAEGKLVVTDGVFSMHGHVAPLPGLRKIASRHGARLMVDEAHSLGIFGETGRGLEEHFGLPGSIDVLMGTFSKAPGSLGGYVTGRADLVEYLRFFARSSMFTAALPAALCAGLTEAFRIIATEPEHRERLWANARHLRGRLEAGGLSVPLRDSPILPVFLGDERLLWAFSRELFERGVKCGSVCHPAVPRGESILRLTLNARHTLEELDRAADAIVGTGRLFGLIGRTPEEIQAIGRRIPAGEARASA
jgi:4-hydroxy-2,2'-bipyrrole-5-methanol synthase